MRSKDLARKNELSGRRIYKTVRDPALFRARADAVPGRAGRKLALGLDPGTTTGYALALFEPGRPFDLARTFVAMGQWDLSAGPFDSGAIRFVRLRQFLAILQPSLVFYEEPRFT